MWKALPPMVEEGEPKCLSFKFCEHETDPLKSIIYERYETKADLDGAHQATLAAFYATAGKIKDVPVKVELTNYTESELGFMERGCAKEAEPVEEASRDDDDNGCDKGASC